MKTYNVVSLITIVVSALWAQSGKIDAMRAEQFKAASGLEAIQKAQGTSLNVSYANSGISFQVSDLASLKNFTVIDEQVKPVFQKGIVKSVYLKSNSNQNDILCVKLIVASETPAALQDIICNEIISTSSASIEQLAVDFKPLQKGAGDFLMGTEADDGKLLYNAAIGKKNSGVLLSTISQTIDLLPVCIEIDSFLNSPAKSDASISDNDFHKIPARIGLSQSLHVKPSQNKSDSNRKVDYVSISRKLKLTVVNDELVVTPRGKTGVDTIAIVNYDLKTLSSQWKTQIVDIQ